MNEQNGLSEKSASILSDVWVTDRKTKRRYTVNGGLWGAILGLMLLLSTTTLCQVRPNSSACGSYIPSSSFTLFGMTVFLMFIAIGFGLYIGSVIGSMHPIYRRISVFFLPLLLSFRFVWPEILNWFQPQLIETFWGKKFVPCALILMAIIYAVGIWLISRKSRVPSPHDSA